MIQCETDHIILGFLYFGRRLTALSRLLASSSRFLTRRLYVFLFDIRKSLVESEGCSKYAAGDHVDHVQLRPRRHK